MKREQISVEKRDITGKKVRKLRREGILPGNVYGQDMKSTAVQLPLKEFTDLYKKVHETGLVDMKLDGKTLPILIHSVQLNPTDHVPLHVDFLKVNLKEKITANIPVISVGEAPAERDKKGVLLQQLSELEVEALPTELPENIEIDITGLTDVNENVTVGQIKAPSGVEIKNDPEQVIFRIGELVTKEAEEQAELEAAEAEEAREEGAEAEAPADTEEKSSESTEEPSEE